MTHPQINYWKIAPGRKASEWEICRDNGCILVGWMELKDFSIYKDQKAILKALKASGSYGGKRDALSIYQFANLMKVGDIVVANDGRKHAMGIGRITSNYLHPKSSKNPNHNGRLSEWCPHARLVDWLVKEPLKFSENVFNIPTVTSLIPERRVTIKKEYGKNYPHLQDTLDELFPDIPTNGDSSFDGGVQNMSLRSALEQFGQIILYGPPGTGKTRTATRLALEILEGKAPGANQTPNEIEIKLKKYRKDDRFDLVVFHPAYEYEQFIGGIEPKADDDGKMLFQSKPGVFLRLCRSAEKHENVVLVIDEINRGNLAKLLGELVYALEYRDHEVTLPTEFGGHKSLRIPKNLYIIGTMNSADRSIGHIDVAIRRRFGLCHLGPEPDIVRDEWKKLHPETGRQMAGLMERLNRALTQEDDPNVEVEHAVGHSYFLPLPGSAAHAARREVEMKWQHQVKPLIREYAEFLNRKEELTPYLSKSFDALLKSDNDPVAKG